MQKFTPQEISLQPLTKKIKWAIFSKKWDNLPLMWDKEGCKTVPKELTHPDNAEL
jgi:hypothetical protein